MRKRFIVTSSFPECAASIYATDYAATFAWDYLAIPDDRAPQMSTWE